MGTLCRVRFAPSSTGYLHIGGARTALFNWLIARRRGGQFVLRIDDTDRARHVNGSVDKILDDLRWLGIDWDDGPYFQSQRLDLYRVAIDKLLDAGHAYFAFDTPQDIDAMRQAARRAGRPFRYPRPDLAPTRQDAAAARAAGRPVVVRFKMPGRDITVFDQILGDVTYSADDLVDDLIIQKSDGCPTYHLACVVDDADMKITHVLRGQDHLVNTPQHIALQMALGYDTPIYAHMPLIFNADGSKMSKRDKAKAAKAGLAPPDIDVYDFRAAGYLPDVLINFVALLGWSAGGDRDKFTRDELIDCFDISRVGKSPARFDHDKLLAFNTQGAASADPDRLLAGLKDYIAVTDSPMASADDGLLRDLLRLCVGFRTFRDVDAKTSFLFLDDAAIIYDPVVVKKVLLKGDGAGLNMLCILKDCLAALDVWTTDSLRACLADVQASQGIGMGKVAQPLRVAVTGSTVSPAIDDTLALLGKDRSLARIDRAIAMTSK